MRQPVPVPVWLRSSGGAESPWQGAWQPVDAKRRGCRTGDVKRRRAHPVREEPATRRPVRWPPTCHCGKRSGGDRTGPDDGRLPPSLRVAPPVKACRAGAPEYQPATPRGRPVPVPVWRAARTRRERERVSHPRGKRSARSGRRLPHRERGKGTVGAAAADEQACAVRRSDDAPPVPAATAEGPAGDRTGAADAPRRSVRRSLRGAGAVAASARRSRAASGMACARKRRGRERVSVPTGGGEAATPKPRAGQARERRGRRRPGGRARARAARRAAAGRAARNAEAETRPKGAAGLRRHRRPPKQPPTLNRRLSSPPVKPAIAGGSQGGSGGRRGCAGGVEAERGIRARARGVRGHLPCRRAARNERSRAQERTARSRACAEEKAPVRERGDGGGTRGSSAVLRRDRPEGPEPPKRQRIRRLRGCPEARAGAAGGRALGRRGGGEPAAILRPARCPAAPAAAATDEARPSKGGFGGSPPSHKAAARLRELVTKGRRAQANDEGGEAPASPRYCGCRG